VTEICNRNYFINLATERIRICKKNKLPIAFVIFDIDHFKNINDQYGHSAGDFVLKKLSQICRSLIGTKPLFARYGGDEFAIAFEEKTEDEVMILVEKIRRRMMNSNNIYEGCNITFECSFGVCYVHEIVNDVLDVFIKYADEALYQSKRERSNRTTLEPFDTL
jgi:diguanylate cyclase (GGDEF)-like protein